MTYYFKVFFSWFGIGTLPDGITLEGQVEARSRKEAQSKAIESVKGKYNPKTLKPGMVEVKKKK